MRLVPAGNDRQVVGRLELIEFWVRQDTDGPVRIGGRHRLRPVGIERRILSRCRRPAGDAAYAVLAPSAPVRGVKSASSFMWHLRLAKVGRGAR